MKRLYTAEVQRELGKVRFSSEKFSEDEFNSLPKPLGRYFHHCGFVGQRKATACKVVFSKVDFKKGNMDLPLYCEQFNFVSEPCRIAYLRSKIVGIIPFEGRDKYQDGKGVMTGKLAKLIKLFDVTGPEMNQSALVTILAETLVLPSYAFQDYISWEELDQYSAKATIRYNGAEASGVFTIDDTCESVVFRTVDRYMDKGKAGFELVPWRAEVVGYRTYGSMLLPKRFRAAWELPEGDLVYFDGLISDINYDVDRL